ncbi:hypothetical protein JG688_00017528 [Phytophthora aleatoria]|uniref:RXLR phytopathogen effector protein WY-domain domain-containing protein n=1 Tax=Phytophthora aleatoria TaxID=2496075 RepID=A0A8J5IX32_9STRA|nr:hypothetical protein JG688_00017528 [Phytophthora aleatoria]
MDMNPTDFFLHLRAVKPGGELEGNPKFIRWLQYAMKYRAKRGRGLRFSDEEILDLLRKTKPEAQLVVLFQSLRQVPGMKTLAENIQACMVLSSASSHRLVNEAWLKSRETPSKFSRFCVLKMKPSTAIPCLFSGSDTSSCTGLWREVNHFQTRKRSTSCCMNSD